MKAGRELDRLVAEKVMGWKRDSAEIRIAQSRNSMGLQESYSLGFKAVLLDPKNTMAFHVLDGPQPYNVADTLPPYSTDIAAAWEALAGAFAVGWAITIKRLDRPEATGDEWRVEIGDVRVISDTAPRAICLALLKWKGAL